MSAPFISERGSEIEEMVVVVEISIARNMTSKRSGRKETAKKKKKKDLVQFSVIVMSSGQ